MHIIIVGAGIGGFAAYHSLKKHVGPLDQSLTLKIVDARPHPTAGAPDFGIGLAPNGLRALASVAPLAAAYICERGFSRGSLTFCNDQGTLLGTFKMGTEERYGKGLGQVVIRHAVVREALLAGGVEDADVAWGKRVVNVEEVEGGVRVTYQDGSSEVVDLVIGADGAEGVVKDSIYSGGGVCRVGKKLNPPSAVGGFLPLSELPRSFQQSVEDHGTVMTFGGKGFIAYSLCSPPPAHSFAQPFSESRTSEKRSADDSPFIHWWTISHFDSSNPENLNSIAVRDHLLKHHGNWASPFDTPLSDKSQEGRIIKLIVEKGCRAARDDSPNPQQAVAPLPTAPFVLPLRTTPQPPYYSTATKAVSGHGFLSTILWRNNFFSPTDPAPFGNQGRIVLVGDAAHPMPITFGNGASCAIEDGVAYAKLLAHHYRVIQGLGVTEGISKSGLASTTATMDRVFEKTARDYESIRMPRI